MRKFRILSFKSEENEEVYTLNERTGLYDKLDRPSVGELDLLYDPEYYIQSVKKENGKIFKVDDKLSNNNTIEGFGFDLNKMFVLDSEENEITLEEANLYVKPEEVKPKVAVQQQNNFKELEDKIIAENRPIQLGNNSTSIYENECKTLKEFLILFFKETNAMYNTYYVDTVRVQTEMNKRRSLADIFMICKNYYPECTLQEVIQLLYVDLYKEIEGFASLKCRMIQKRIWWIFGERERKDHQELLDEYNNDWNYYIKTLKIKKAPEVVKVVEKSLLEQAKEKYTIGKRVESQEGGVNFIVDTNNFDDGLRKIILVVKSGRRKTIYNKQTKVWSRIIR